MLWLRLAWREIRHHPRFSVLFIFNLALGMLGLVLLDSFKAALEETVEQSAKQILSADLSVYARRELTPEEQKAIEARIPPSSVETQMAEMYSMASGPRGSRLLSLRAIEDTFPFYGQIVLASGAVLKHYSVKKVVSEKVIWISPELEAQLGVKVGDKVRIGETEFRVDDILVDDPGNAWKGLSLAPRAYIGKKFLGDTKLIQMGSTVFREKLFKLPASASAENVAQALRADLKDPAIYVDTPKSASEQTTRVMNYLNDYLGLVALVALFFSAVGGAYLFRSFLASRQTDIAILQSLGTRPGRAQRIYIIQLMILGTASTLIASTLGLLLLPLITRAIQQWIPFPLDPVLQGKSVAMAWVIGALGSLLPCLPLLIRIRQMRPSLLFQESAAQPLHRLKASTVLSLVPALLFFWGLAVIQAHSFQVGSWFILLFSLMALGLSLIVLLGIRALSRVPDRRIRSLKIRLAFRNLLRSPLSTLTSFLAIALGSLLLNLIPQLQQSIESEIAQPEGTVVPSLFLFDIQEEQVGELKNLVASQKIEIQHLSPMVRARLEAINGKPVERQIDPGKAKTREEEREIRSRNRGYNLSYREKLSTAERIVKGREFSGPYDPARGELPEISLETRFAERMLIGIGDVLKFDIQGVFVEGRVINLRRVKWTSFQPNFFIQFQPGSLADAPKVFLAAIPKLSAEERNRLQDALVQKFPNISIIDVENTVRKILSVFIQMSWAMRLMAIFTLISGLIVLFSIASHQASARKKDASLLRVLGAKHQDVRAILHWEFGVLAFLAALAGSGAALVMSYALSLQFFEGSWKAAPEILLLTWVSVPLVSILTAHFGAQSMLRQKPAALLQS